MGRNRWIDPHEQGYTPGMSKPNGKSDPRLWVINTATDFKQENAIVGWARGDVRAGGAVTLVDPMWMLIHRNEKGQYIHIWYTPGGSIAYDSMHFEVRSCVLAHEGIIRLYQEWREELKRRGGKVTLATPGERAKVDRTKAS